MKLLPAIGLLTGLALATPAFADPCEGTLPGQGAKFGGQVRYVGDGDSFCVGANSDPATWVEVRLADFYAPELGEPTGEAAKEALQDLVMGRSVSCVAGRRSYDRVVAQCWVGGTDIGELLRRRGVREGGRGR
jgi:endonuclease YncB( thermonuclease family)